MKKINTYTVTYKLMRKELFEMFALRSGFSYEPEEVRAYINEYIAKKIRNKLIVRTLTFTV
jgi:hypothetical protein